MSSSNYETPSSELTTTDESAASCLMLLSKVGELSPPIEKSFDCKTCGKVFPTFQALGGHRASHKKPKLDQADQSPSKPKSHKCSICGAEFALGQALGGHMRRHRDSSAIISKKVQSGGGESETTTVLMRSNSKRVCLNLDLDLDLSLNLKPPEIRDDDLVMAESDLKLRLGKRDYEMKKSKDLGRLQEYDLRMQMGKRRRLGDACLGLVVWS